jgi:predicted metal-binding membrane protein
VHSARRFLFLMCHGGFRRDAEGCLLLGLRHGAYCVGYCWVLMTPLLVGSVMNVLWIAPLASLVLSEKLTSIGCPIARFAGIVFIVAGARLSFRGMS